MNPNSAEFYYGIDGQRYGPVDLASLRSLLRSGQLSMDDYLWDEDLQNWRLVREYPHLIESPAGDSDFEDDPGRAGENPAGFDAEDLPRSDPWSSGTSPADFSRGIHPVHPQPAHRAPTQAQHGGFLDRFLAHLIDSIILMVPVMIWIFLVATFHAEELETINATVDAAPYDPLNAPLPSASLMFWFYLGLVVIPWLYEAAMVSSFWQATIGKRAMGLVVTDENGYRIGFLRATGRFFGKYLSQIFWIGFILIFVTERRQGLHDLLVRTLVLRIR